MESCRPYSWPKTCFRSSEATKMKIKKAKVTHWINKLLKLLYFIAAKVALLKAAFRIPIGGHGGHFDHDNLHK